MIDRLLFRLPAAVILLASIAFIQQCAAHAPSKIMLVSESQLREFGIDVTDPSSFPNKCYGSTSLSDALVERFKLKGFTLQTLCLAVNSSWVAYHPETGEALKIAALGEQGPSFLLNPPDCFKHGAPFLDCWVTYDMDAGIKDPKVGQTRQRAQLVDAAVRRLIAAGQFRRDCQCEDLEFNDTSQKVTIKKGASCHADTIPACPDPKIRAESGRLLFEADGINFDGVPTKGFTDYGRFDISPNLFYGYAYMVGSPEGDTDTEYVSLPSGEKL
jgi:hypothetical protein